jgi:hypothetical protein
VPRNPNSLSFSLSPHPRPAAACFPLLPSPTLLREHHRPSSSSGRAPPPSPCGKVVVDPAPTSDCLPIRVKMERSKAVRSRSAGRSSPLNAPRRAASCSHRTAQRRVASRSHRAAAVVPSRRRRYGGGAAGLGQGGGVRGGGADGSVRVIH